MKKRYFHVQNNVLIDEKWNEGDVIDTSNDFNRFYKSIVSSIGTNNGQNQLLEYARKTFDSNQVDIFNPDPQTSLLRINSLEGLTQNLYEALSQANKFIREELFEIIRSEHYNHRPSRRNGIWLTDIEHLENWFSGFDNNPRIYEIEILEQVAIFETDADLIVTDDRTIEELKESAHSYWKAEFNMGELKLKEILFEGKMKIISEYNSLNT